MITDDFLPANSAHLSLGVAGSVGVEVVADRARWPRFAASRTSLWKKKLGTKPTAKSGGMKESKHLDPVVRQTSLTM